MSTGQRVQRVQRGGLLLALSGILAGCPVVPAPPVAAPGRTPAPNVSTRPSATPSEAPTSSPTATPAAPTPSPTPTPTPPVPLGVEPSAIPDGRALVDRPDDEPGLALHVLYVLPADAPDGHLDEDGTLEASLGRLDGWLAGESGGRRLKLDRYRGRPDITYFRAPQTTAALVGDDGAIIDRLRPALTQAGFDHPQKIYAAYVMAPGKDPTVGEGGSGLACVYLASEPGLSAKPGPSGLTWFDAAFGHELIHALGGVPAGAPHFVGAADQGASAEAGHVGGEPTDLMAAQASNGLLALDVGRDDYWGHGDASRLDLARSPFFVPVPADALPPVGRPLALEPAPGALPLASSNAVPAPRASAEARLAASAAAAWGAAGLTLPPADPRLADAARRLATARAAGVEPDTAALLRQAGVFGAWGARYSGLSFSVQPSADSAIAQLLDGLTAANFPVASDDRGATAYGLGVAAGPAGVMLAVTTGRAAIAVDDLKLGDGPLGTYTLTGRVARTPGSAATRALLVLDARPLDWSIALDTAGQARFAVTLTRDRAHTVAVGTPDDAEARVAIDAELGSIDARLALPDAVRAFYGE